MDLLERSFCLPHLRYLGISPMTHSCLHAHRKSRLAGQTWSHAELMWGLFWVKLGMFMLLFLRVSVAAAMAILFLKSLKNYQASCNRTNLTSVPCLSLGIRDGLRWGVRAGWAQECGGGDSGVTSWFPLHEEGQVRGLWGLLVLQFPRPSLRRI